MKLEKKNAVVTGSGRGIGRAIAIAFAREGAGVAIIDVNQENCNKVVQEITRMGGKAIAVKCDVSAKVEVDDMVRKVIAEFSKIDILVNNAGIVGFKPFLDLTEEEWDKMLSINLKGQFLCSQAIAREMVKAKSGRIINIASISSGGCQIAFPMIAHYTASKAGVLGLTKALALELAPQGISVNAISPGAVNTEIAQSNEEQKKATIARIPKGRIAEPEDIANLAVFLATPESDYITGADIIIDGGWLTT
jgi:NAD(P)-dependent dehydrogenase (short-subunit alcohol dehydrogenase family)